MNYLDAKPNIQQWTGMKVLAASGVQFCVPADFERNQSWDEMMAYNIERAKGSDLANSTNLMCVILRGEWVATIYTKERP